MNAYLMHSVTSAPCRIDDVTIGCACVDRRGASRDEHPSIFCHSLIHLQHDSRDPDQALIQLTGPVTSAFFYAILVEASTVKLLWDGY